MLKAAGKALFVTILLTLAACAQKKPTTLRYLLPPPPEIPRLEWLATYSGENDFPKTEAERNMEKLAGKTPLRLTAPAGIASDGKGRVFVGDLQEKNILVFDLNARKSYFLLAKGNVEPRQMTFDSNGQLFVADGAHHCVKVYSSDGQLLRTYGSREELQKPIGIAIDEQRHKLYVSDGLAHQVVVFALESGEVLMVLGTGFTSKQGGDLYNPAGLALAADGTLCVVEHLNARISLFNPDGTFQSFFGVRNAGAEGFENPRAAAFDSEGNLWVVDFRREALRAYTLDGQLLFVQEAPERDRMGFSTPVAIHIDANDEIFVSDFAAGRFSHWRYLSKLALAHHPITDEDLELINKALTPVEEEYIGPTPPK